MITHQVEKKKNETVGTDHSTGRLYKQYTQERRACS